MFRIYGLLWAIGLILMVFSLIDAISTDESRMRNLPKLWWILLILFFPLAGSIAWLVAGRPEAAKSRSGAVPHFPEYDRPGRAVPTDTVKDDDFLKQVRERAEEQRIRYEKQKMQEREQGQAETD